MEQDLFLKTEMLHQSFMLVLSLHMHCYWYWYYWKIWQFRHLDI